MAALGCHNGPMRTVLAFLGLLVAGLAAAAPPPEASRAELTRWLGQLAETGTDTRAPLRWHYTFEALDGRALERLSGALVAAGYEIVSLGPGSSLTVLRVARVELHSPRTLERRNAELVALARVHGARYAGVAPL